jgi:DNA-binding NarL/FixJ family response regulator
VSERADTLEQAAQSMWLKGRTADALSLRAEAFEAFVAEARPAEAAMAAVLLAILHLGRGEEPQASGWLGRASDLARGIPGSRVHGYLIFLGEVEQNLRAGRPAAAVDAARRLRELGQRIGDPDLAVLGLHAEGRSLMRAGNVVDGLKLIDEAMLAVSGGRLTTFMCGTLYCHTIAACHEVSDIRRMGRWSELADEWVDATAAVVFDGLCAVHRAQLQLLRGELVEAESTALGVVALLDSARIDYAAEAWYVVADSRRLRGVRSAPEAYAEAHARGRDPQPGRALLQLRAGDATGAARAIRSAMAAAGTDPLKRAPLCAAAVDIQLAAGAIDDARASAAELERTAKTYPTSGLQAMEVTARGAVILSTGDSEAALPVLRAACQRWLELASPIEAAQVCERLAEAYEALGDHASAAAELARANATYARVGLHSTGLPDGLSRREAEVLGLLAAGGSNREIAEALVISDRTVARHLTNLYRKIGVTSRTQATRYAIDHGLATSS